MDLKSALRRVIKVCPKGKDASLFRAVRFIPGVNDKSAGVLATDGLVIVYVPVAGTLPDAVVALDGLASAVKDTGDLSVVVDGDGIALTGFNAVYKLVSRSNDSEYFPSLPKHIPSVFGYVAWADIRKVLHAAATDKSAALSVLHFGPDYVEALDKVRIARVTVPNAWQGFVTARLFAHWPKGSVCCAFTDHHAFFAVGEEMRITALGSVNYPPTDKLFKAVYTGFSLVDAYQLTQAVKQATDVSPLNLVMLTVAGRVLEVRACDVNGRLDSYLGTVPAISQSGEMEVTIDGKLLQQALAQCDTPSVKLSAGSSVDPLQIESGTFTECLWQKYWGD